MKDKMNFFIKLYNQIKLAQINISYTIRLIMNSQKKSKQLKEKLQKNYEKIVHKQQYSAVEALHQILDNKTSIKKINIGLVSIGKSDDLSAIIWNNRTHKSKFLKICEELVDYFDEQRDHSMRSTEKNLSQMNDQVSKMRKSLSQKGLIEKIKGNIFQISETASRLSEKKTNQNDNKKLQNKLLEYEGEQKNQQLIREEQNYQLVYEQQTQNQKQKQQLQLQQKKSNEQKEKQEQKVNSQQVGYEKSQKSQKPQKAQKSQNPQKPQKQKKVSQKEHKQELQENQWSWGEKDGSKQKEQKEGNKKVHVQNKVKTDHKQRQRQINKKQQIKEQNKSEKSQIKKKQAQIALVGRIENNQSLIKNQKSQNKKLDTLPEEKDNQFYEEKATRQKLKPQQKKPKYNPHLEIMKKQIQKKRQQPQPRNQLQGLYYSLQTKLLELFSHYIKELKTNSFTFDGHPQCLDLKTFSNYYKYFKLGQICKIAQITKYFKKYSINGTWMNQQNFIQIHSKILQLGEDAIKTIDETIKQKEQLLEKYEISLNQLAKSNLPQNSKKIKQKELNEKKNSSENKYRQVEQKLKKINTLISQQQLRKLIRKGQKKLKSPQTSIESISYDRDRLKKIVQAHTHNGINREESILKLTQRKVQKQKKNQQKVYKILQKYKFQNNSSVNSSSSFNKKNNQSAPQLRKIQGYARRNKILRHGITTPQTQSHQSPHKQHKQKLSMQQKTKPYFQLKQTNLPKRQQETTVREKEKKIQVYKQLSLPKLPKRKMRQLSIYQSLKLIDTKAELQFIKNLLSEKTVDEKQDERIFNQYYKKQKQIMEKQKTRKSPIQDRMKFS